MLKKNVIEELVRRARLQDADFRVLYVDEATCYRQPSVAQTWWLTGKKCPVAPLSHRSNTKIRIAGALDVREGRIHYHLFSRCGVAELTRFWKSLASHYHNCEKVYLVMDNWPVHFHQRIWDQLKQSGRVEPVPLPTYAPWLNPIEKVWRYLKQKTIHMHAMSDDLDKLKLNIASVLDQFKSGSTEMLRYAGLCIT